MTVSKSILEIWKSKKKYGDLKKAAELSGLAIMTIHRAFSSGKCSPETFNAINDYFINKDKELKIKEKELQRRMKKAAKMLTTQN